MENDREDTTDWQGTVRSAVDDVAESVRLVIDVVVGHGANLVAHALQRVDQLVDDVVADAADVAREAEALFSVACPPEPDAHDGRRARSRT